MRLSFRALTDVHSIDEVCDPYNRLLTQLYGDARRCTLTDLQEVKRRRDSELLVFAFCGGMMQGTAFATYSSRPPYPKIHIDSVVVDTAARGEAVGSKLMDALHRSCLKQWPDTTCFQLTSGPQRGTRSFYERLGYTARASDEPGGTIAYQKQI